MFIWHFDFCQLWKYSWPISLMSIMYLNWPLIELMTTFFLVREENCCVTVLWIVSVATCGIFRWILSFHHLVKFNSHIFFFFFLFGMVWCQLMAKYWTPGIQWTSEYWTFEYLTHLKTRQVVSGFWTVF
jgi:peptidoglycan/LPS O-acetylase OafA/YrhL